MGYNKHTRAFPHGGWKRYIEQSFQVSDAAGPAGEVKLCAGVMVCNFHLLDFIRLFNEITCPTENNYTVIAVRALHILHLNSENQYCQPSELGSNGSPVPEGKVTSVFAH